MVFHVGIDPANRCVSYCNENEKIIIDIEINNVYSYEIIKVDLMFEEIKSKINGKFGYACIVLHLNYGNEIRKKFIECGLKSGFKNVEIINLETAFYLNAMSQINYIPLNGNVIWIQYYSEFYVWAINNQKAKFCGKWKADSSKLNELQKIVDESKLNKGPNVVFCDKKIDESNLRKISECQCFLYSDNDYWHSKGSLLKAQITVGDSECTHLETTNFLSRTFSLKIGNNVIKSFKYTQQLPIIYKKTIIKNSKNDMLEVNTDRFIQETPFALPEYSPIFLTFTFDENEVFSVTFDEKPNVNGMGDESH